MSEIIVTTWDIIDGKSDPNTIETNTIDLTWAFYVLLGPQGYDNIELILEDGFVNWYCNGELVVLVDGVETNSLNGFLFGEIEAFNHARGMKAQLKPAKDQGSDIYFSI